MTDKSLSISAYVLAADTSKLVESIKSYYSLVTKIVISCDGNSRGWTGAPIRVGDVISVVKSIDTDNKCIIHYGDYSRAEFALDPMAGDTCQRNEALSVAAEYGDWILQIDADEVVSDISALVDWIQYAENNQFEAVEWPLSVLYRQIGSDYLVVCGADKAPIYEYPGAVAVRAGCSVIHARRVDRKMLRLVVREDVSSKSLLNDIQPNETRLMCLRFDQSIMHYSWSRSTVEIFEKVSSWGHANGFKSYMYVIFVWLLSPVTYRFLRNIHPMSGSLWPRLTLWTGVDSCD
jgi:hypothetical protein